MVARLLADNGGPDSELRRCGGDPIYVARRISRWPLERANGGGWSPRRRPGRGPVSL